MNYAGKTKFYETLDEALAVKAKWTSLRRFTIGGHDYFTITNDLNKEEYANLQEDILQKILSLVGANKSSG